MEQIGRYQISGEVGRGAMGVVYRAQDPAIGRVVAIKTIRLSDLTDPSERERLRDRLFREAQTAGILSHPHIVTIYDIAEENGLAYVFMEFVDGPPLERVLGEPALPSRDLILSVLRQTASALDYAHSKGIVHRDIKPANIMLHESVQAKVTDFGVAKILSQQMTQSGTMMGTPNYMSPEQVQGHAVDGRADQFALAVIAYEILTGEKPFVGEYLPTLLYKIVREDPIAPQRLNPTLGNQIESVLRKGLSKNPESRYESCTQLVEDLVAACEANPGWRPQARGASQSLPTLGDTRKSNGHAAGHPLVLPPSRPRRHEESANPLIKSLIWMLVGIGLVGLVLLGAQRYLFNRTMDEPQATTAPSVPAAPPPNPVQPAPDTPPKPSPVGEASKPDGLPGEERKTPPAGRSTQPAVENSLPATLQEAEPEEPKRAARTAPTRTREVAPAPQPAQPVDHSVQFLTEPPGAQVVVDSDASLTCRTPCMLTMPSGRHVVNARLEGFRPYPRVINVPQDSDIFLQLSKASATLSITSSPPGAAIALNGVEQRSRTPLLLNVAPGTYRVRVTKDGVPFEFDVTMRDGEFINKNVKF